MLCNLKPQSLLQVFVFEWNVGNIACQFNIHLKISQINNINEKVRNTTNMSSSEKRRPVCYLECKFHTLLVQAHCCINVNTRLIQLVLHAQPEGILRIIAHYWVLSGRVIE